MFAKSEITCIMYLPLSVMCYTEFVSVVTALQK